MYQRSKKLVTYGKRTSNRSQKGPDRATGSSTSHANFVQRDISEDHTNPRIKRMKTSTIEKDGRAQDSDTFSERSSGRRPYGNDTPVYLAPDVAKVPEKGDTREAKETSQIPSSHPAIDRASLDTSPSKPHHGNLTPARRRLVDHLNMTEKPPSLNLSPSMERTMGGGDPELDKSSHSNSGHPGDDQHSQSSGHFRQDGSLDLGSSQELASQPATGLRGSKVTYARQRSFLNDMSFLEEDGLSRTSSHGKQSFFMTAPSSTIPSCPDDDETNDSRPVRSIHELRQSGDNARFRETVELMFEDIEDPDTSISQRCSGLIQLCEKLLDRACVSRFSEYGFDERLVKSMTKDLDVTSISLLLCAYRMACDGGSFSHALLSLFWSRLLEVAPALLDVEEDLLSVSKQCSRGISRRTQTSIKRILPELASALSGDLAMSDMSPQFVTLSSISHVLQRVREKENVVEALSASLIDRLIRLVTLEDLDESSLSSQRSQRSVLVLSILETYTVLSGPLDPEQCVALRPLAELHTLLNTEQHGPNRHILILYVRLILNLTNKDTSLCEVFTTPQVLSELVHIIKVGFSEVPDDSGDKENSSLNTVILALGALTNLAEKDDSSRAMFLIQSPGPTSFLQALLQQFSASIGFVDQAHSVPEMHHSVALGYLAILLITICLNPEALTLAKNTIGEKGMALILSTSQEFLQHYQRVEQDSPPFEGRDEKESQFTARLEHIISKVRQCVGKT
ncbi:wings apart-like protein regulation of heterochromatin-domain-containing protein [Aspergillus ambiguus]|uniref:WAPL family protein n=1 Tax=Aspergillus ambiguus TaxID=176160 RepID=UPI003CCCD100